MDTRHGVGQGGRALVERSIYRQATDRYSVCFILDGKPRFRTVGYDPDMTRAERWALIDAARWVSSLLRPGFASALSRSGGSAGSRARWPAVSVAGARSRSRRVRKLIRGSRGSLANAWKLRPKLARPRPDGQLRTYEITELRTYEITAHCPNAHQWQVYAS